MLPELLLVANLLLTPAQMVVTPTIEVGSTQRTDALCHKETDIMEVVNTHKKFGLKAAQGMFRGKVNEGRCEYSGRTHHFIVTLVEHLYHSGPMEGNVVVDVWKATTERNGKTLTVYLPHFTRPKGA